jgi:Ni,Fe-hydrogenase I small subunit
MAITRRQFVLRLGALAAAAGLGQAEMSKIAESFGALSNDMTLFGTLNKPRVIWIHGQECTGCSTSVLSILESGSGKPIYGDSATTTGDALKLAGVQDASGNLALTLAGGLRVDGALVNIADVVIDVIDLEYHETVMGMAGDLAAQWLNDFMTTGLGDSPVTGGTKLPFVLVVEGALAPMDGPNAWGDTTNNESWCSIGMSDAWDAETKTGGFENDMPDTVKTLAAANNCLAVLPIGQCACYGGYPHSLANIATAAEAEFDPTIAQTGAMGTFDYLTWAGEDAAAGKVINTPGCPTNPFWFVLTVLGVMIELQGVLGRGGSLGLFDGVGPAASALDTAPSRRFKIVYPIPVHSAYCPNFRYYTQGIFASHPGEHGCLQKIGCKGLYTKSLCGVHGWNNMQPQNGADATFDPATIPYYKSGSHCTMAGHPCMGCTEPGYPARFTYFVKI